jgi:hypothetical protein
MGNVDLIGTDGVVQGDMAAYMVQQGRLDPNRMRPFIGSDGKSYFTVYKGGKVDDPANYSVVPAINTNATLRRDEWKALDDAVMAVAEQRLGGVADLEAKGLVYTLGNAMGTTVLEWHDVSSALEADLTMDGVTRAQNNRPDFKFNYLPIPIIHVDYEINARALAASRNMGNPLDTTMAERAARTVQEKLESMLFTDTTYSFGEKDSRTRNTIYSYVNHPDRNQVSLGTAWDDSAKTGKDIVDEVISLKQTAINDRHYGPYQLYIPTAYETVLDEDYVGSTPDTAPNTTIRQRLLSISGITGIKVIDTLPADNVLLVQMTSDVVRLVRGLGLQNIEWSTEGKFVNKYKVITIAVPQIRSDANGRSGIVHLA